MNRKTTIYFKNFVKVSSKKYYTKEKWVSPKITIFGAQKLNSGGNHSPDGGNGYLILLANLLVQDIEERSVCTKFGENPQRIALSIAQIYYYTYTL